MEGIETDSGAQWHSASTTSSRPVSYMSNHNAAVHPQPARLTYRERPTKLDDDVYRFAIQRMRQRACKSEHDSDSARSVNMEDIPAYEEDDQALPTSVAHSLLFSLPREIRDRIYALCVQSRDGLPVEWPRSEAHRRHNPYDIQTALLRTCRAVHSEAAPLLYSLNNLTFHHPSDANVFVRAICDLHFGIRITSLSLHVKAADIRMWMSYLNTTDPTRSLRFDFPNLRNLGLRYKSSRWNHAHSADHNLKSWVDDPRLDELLDGIRDVYCSYWCSPQEEKARADEEQELIGFDPDNCFPEPQDSNPQEQDRQREHYFLLRHTRLERARQKELCPTIRICCACRVHPTHFQSLTRPAAVQMPQHQRPPGVLPEAKDLPQIPVVEGGPFPPNGFSHIDLQRDVKKLHDPELGSANVSRTPYVLRKGVLLALEIHSVDARRE
ncbi:hypothetical protein CB0940_02742 [Cercospora beticola]|uniref:F-box domain-containing protein n=1 Tax=Cercospora beticola TaxID=122368 RepID=A0A2G5I2N6_CERBT|nr:hypothetical protein CB0940_02742 [Cercospora beticola]PIA99059.1 hypothetical protein CB0940_02742 [Cercospora beticola]WPA99890.1 hypothetical protein RHO25_004510 [Cercospora beticola]CAK1361939.1 unnamed protein product [Cercospora beticola]